MRPVRHSKKYLLVRRPTSHRRCWRPSLWRGRRSGRRRRRRGPGDRARSPGDRDGAVRRDHVPLDRGNAVASGDGIPPHRGVVRLATTIHRSLSEDEGGTRKLTQDFGALRPVRPEGSPVPRGSPQEHTHCAACPGAASLRHACPVSIEVPPAPAAPVQKDDGAERRWRPTHTTQSQERKTCNGGQGAAGAPGRGGTHLVQAKDPSPEPISTHQTNWIRIAAACRQGARQRPVCDVRCLACPALLKAHDVGVVPTRVEERVEAARRTN
jgi:hypothetical protein